MSVTKFAISATPFVAAAAALLEGAGWPLASALVAVTLIVVGGVLLALWQFIGAAEPVRRDVIEAIDKVATAARGRDGAHSRRGDGASASGRSDDSDSSSDDGR